MPPGPPLQPDTDDRLNAGDALAWDAFRYVTDALGPAEVDAFEQRLIEDQAAREAVAAAVDQFAALTLVAREVAATVPDPIIPRWSKLRHGRLLLAGAAAAAALLAAWVFQSPGVDRETQAGPDVIAAWTRLRAAAQAVEPTPAGPTLDIAAADTGFPSDRADAEVGDVPAEKPLPSWIMAAVAPEPTDDATNPEGN